MKVKLVKPPYNNVPEDFSLTLGKVYECSKISLWKSAYIIDDNGVPSLLYEDEYEVLEGLSNEQ